MKKILLVLFLVILSSSAFCQQKKRLALIIGNANYNKGALKNPVNDANLMAKTLDSLDFEVLLYTNLENRRDLLSAISDFGRKRPSYDFGFIFYAGHGVQVDSENYLLPTKEIFQSEIDVQDYGVSLQRVLKLLESGEEELNILVLDACRDNPFEQTWNKTRSLKGNGLAKIPPPTGSLIAFSTDAGQTAPDGDGENSLYTEVLTKNLLKGGLSIEQIFKNVRGEVLEKSNGLQRPAEATQLVGKPYVINKSEIFQLEEELKEILSISDPYTSLKDSEKLNFTEVTNKVLFLDDKNKIGLIGVLFMELNNLVTNNFEETYQQIIELKIDEPLLNFVEVMFQRRLLKKLDNLPAFTLSIDELKKETVEVKEKISKDLSTYILYLNKTYDAAFNKKTFKLSEQTLYIKWDISIWPYSRIAEWYYLLGDNNKSLEYYNLFFKLYDKLLDDNKDFFNKNPEYKANIDRTFVFAKVDYLNMQKQDEGFNSNLEWRKLFKQFPNNTNLLNTRANTLIQLEEYDLAEIIVNKIIPLDDLDPEPHVLLFHINKYNKNWLAALHNIESAKTKLAAAIGTQENPGSGHYISRGALKFGELTIGYDKNLGVVKMWELFLIKASVYKELNNKKLMCFEYNNTLNLIKHDPKKAAEIETLISENCNN